MKKVSLVILLAVALGLAFATGAGAYVIGWFSQPFEIKEPIAVKIVQTPTSPMWPGSTFVVDYEIANQQAEVIYGMSYGGYILYDYSGKKLRFELDKQPAKEKEPNVRLLQKPEESAITSGPGAGPPIPVPGHSNWGQISFDLTANNKTEPYSPYAIVNIGAKSVHLLKTKIRPSADLSPGRWEFSLVVNRDEPNPGSPEPLPTTTAVPR